MTTSETAREAPKCAADTRREQCCRRTEAGGRTPARSPQTRARQTGGPRAARQQEGPCARSTWLQTPAHHAEAAESRSVGAGGRCHLCASFVVTATGSLAGVRGSLVPPRARQGACGRRFSFPLRRGPRDKRAGRGGVPACPPGLWPVCRNCPSVPGGASGSESTCWPLFSQTSVTSGKGTAEPQCALWRRLETGQGPAEPWAEASGATGGTRCRGPGLGVPGTPERRRALPQAPHPARGPRSKASAPSLVRGPQPEERRPLGASRPSPPPRQAAVAVGHSAHFWSQQDTAHPDQLSSPPGTAGLGRATRHARPGPRRGLEETGWAARGRDGFLWFGLCSPHGLD